MGKVRITMPGKALSVEFKQESTMERMFNKLAVDLLKEREEKEEEEETSEEITESEPENMVDIVKKEVDKLPEEAVETDKGPEYKAGGFLHIRCPKCGKIKSFATKPIKGYHCFECGADTLFEEPLKTMYVNCECGQRTRYLTNMDEKLFDVECIGCGSPVPIIWNNNKKIFETIRD